MQGQERSECRKNISKRGKGELGRVMYVKGKGNRGRKRSEEEERGKKKV